MNIPQKELTFLAALFHGMLTENQTQYCRKRITITQYDSFGQR